MNIATLINALKTSYPKIWRRIQVLSRQKKMSIPATLINCLEGETTQRGNDATLKKGGVFTRPKGETTQRGNDATLKKGGVFTRPKGETTQRKGA